MAGEGASTVTAIRDDVDELRRESAAGFVANMLVSVHAPGAGPAALGGTLLGSNDGVELRRTEIGVYPITQLCRLVMGQDGSALTVVCSAADEQWSAFADQFDAVVDGATLVTVTE
jgi:hypothetical protein